MNYHIWTEGCQMNIADSQRVASELEKLGHHAARNLESADIVVLNTCVVRQSAEDKAINHLWNLKPLKEKNPEMILGVMGCMIGVRDASPLQKLFPFVDVFMPPSDPARLIEFLRGQNGQSEDYALDQREKYARDDYQDETTTRGDLVAPDFVLPAHERGALVSAHVPIVYGCNHVCTFCIIPYRRGKERSRAVGEIAAEIRALVQQGVKEVTLLGQIVDRYGYDISDGPRLPDLLRVINDIDGLARIRFLTSHPSYMTDDLLDAISELPKVCEHIEVPVQAGDDEMLKKMKRGYTVDDYRALIARIRAKIPHASIATDIIVGMPGETEKQFLSTYDLLNELKLDVAHVAMFSPRPNTVAAKWEDDVPFEEKERRRLTIDHLQAEIVAEINQKFLGETVEVLVEEKIEKKNRWKGRTRQNKLVFFEDDARDWKGKPAHVKINWTGPWSMIGEL
ncbi:MAG: tRNA (N6-isopentenyl adenosine(37)-C2)-methylthiotransferase MiaB [Chloroflexi bacterium]|nr:tRNA (N6-isopentenyl adenosine(37)-C2)-methylthiotransferase MiaB [Chloroflexota bacterium]